MFRENSGPFHPTGMAQCRSSPSFSAPPGGEMAAQARRGPSLVQARTAVRPHSPTGWTGYSSPPASPAPPARLSRSLAEMEDVNLRPSPQLQQAPKVVGPASSSATKGRTSLGVTTLGKPVSRVPLRSAPAQVQSPRSVTAAPGSALSSATLSGAAAAASPSAHSSAAAPAARKRPSLCGMPGAMGMSPSMPSSGGAELRQSSPELHATKAASTGSTSRAGGMPERAVLRVPSMKSLKEQLQRKSAPKTKQQQQQQPSPPRQIDEGASGDGDAASPHAQTWRKTPAQGDAHSAALTWKMAPPADTSRNSSLEQELEEVEIDGFIEEPKCSVTPAMEGCLSTKDSESSATGDVEREHAGQFPPTFLMQSHSHASTGPSSPLPRVQKEHTSDSVAGGIDTSWALPSDVEELSSPVHPSGPIGTLRGSSPPPEAVSPPVVDTPRPVSAASSGIPVYGAEGPSGARMSTDTSSLVLRREGSANGASNAVSVTHGTTALATSTGYLGSGPFWTCGNTPIRNSSRRHSRAGSRQGSRPGVPAIPAPLPGAQDGLLGRVRTAVCQGITVCGNPRTSSPIDLPSARRASGAAGSSAEGVVGMPSLQVEALISGCMGMLATALDVPGGKDQVPDNELSTISLETKEQRLMWRDFLSEAVSQSCTSRLFASYDVEASPGHYPRPPPSSGQRGPRVFTAGSEVDDPDPLPEDDDTAEADVKEPIAAAAVTQKMPDFLGAEWSALTTESTAQSTDMHDADRLASHPANGAASSVSSRGSDQWLAALGQRHAAADVGGRFHVDINNALVTTAPSSMMKTTGPVSREAWMTDLSLGAPASTAPSRSDPVVRSQGALPPKRHSMFVQPSAPLLGAAASTGDAAGAAAAQGSQRLKPFIRRPMTSSQPSLIPPGQHEPPGEGPALRSPLLGSRSMMAPPGAGSGDKLQARLKQRSPAPAPLRGGAADGRPQAAPAPAG
mmetsp:Transcript_7365/g.16120  ORF Transcript_7365/g.16120 Transcript_7365/m.16120 type:complete len:962 (-) Transcript_7365:245-3130(-)